jgi:hypothetical protein
MRSLPQLALLAVLLVTHSWCSAQDVAFKQITIDVKPPQNPWVKVLADLNLDGNQDIIIGGSKGPLVWYEFPTWKRHTITTGGYATVDAEAADIDGDGDADIAMGGVVWFENPGPEKISKEGSWQMRRVAELRSHDVEVGDLDGDGRLDLVTPDQTTHLPAMDRRLPRRCRSDAG